MVRSFAPPLWNSERYQSSARARCQPSSRHSTKPCLQRFARSHINDQGRFAKTLAEWRCELGFERPIGDAIKTARRSSLVNVVPHPARAKLTIKEAVGAAADPRRACG